MGELRFRFADEEESCDYVSRLAADMPLYPPEHVLSGGFLYEEWRPDLVRGFCCLPAMSAGMPLAGVDPGKRPIHSPPAMLLWPLCFILGM